MILHQIWWNSSFNGLLKYRYFLQHNSKIYKELKINYHFWNTKRINEFLDKFDYKDIVFRYTKDSFYYQSNLIRLLILYEYGGTYLDLDVLLYSSFSDFLVKFKNFDVFLAIRSLYFFKVKKKSEFIKNLLDRILTLNYLKSDKKFLYIDNHYKDIIFLPEIIIQKYLHHYYMYRRNNK